MPTRDDVLNEARRWLGTAEQPAGSNNVPGITDWYGLRGAWCAMFVSRVFFNAGMPLPATTPKGFAWVSAGFDWFRTQPDWQLFTDWHQAQPGDLVAWEWGLTPGGYDHISIVETNNPFTTIGGNERDQVKREFFGAPGGAVLFARPPYTTPTPTPAPPPTTTRWKDPAMYTVTNAAGAVITFRIDPTGGLVHSWRNTDGTRSKWVEVTPGLTVENLGQPIAAGEQIWLPIVASHPSYGDQPLTLIQRTVGNTWEVHHTDQLHKILSGLT